MRFRVFSSLGCLGHGAASTSPGRSASLATASAHMHQAAAWPRARSLSWSPCFRGGAGLRNLKVQGLLRQRTNVIPVWGLGTF